MALPPRVFWTIYEASARWGCIPADIAAWAATDRLEICTSIPPVTCGDKVAAGLVVVAGADILPMFRRNCTGPRSCEVRRLRLIHEPEWLYMTEPERGITVEAADLVIMAAEVARFEAEHEVFGRPGRSTGPEFKYEWDDMYVHIIRRVHEQGVPATQAEFVAEVQEWFMRRSDTGDAPDERTIRRRITPIWRALTAAA